MPNENKIFEDTAKNWFKTDLQLHPIGATYLGIHKYDHLMPDVSKKKLIEEIKFQKQVLEKFQKFDKSKLSLENSLDKDLAIHILKLSLYFDEELRFWESDPDAASLIAGAIFPLFVRNFAPYRKRLENIIKRLEQSKRILEQTKKRVTKPVKLWVEMSIESAERTPFFLKEILEYSKTQKISKKSLDKLEKTINRTNKLLTDYIAYLKTILPKSSEKYHLTKKKFDKLVELRELGLSSEQILKIGENYLKEGKRELKNLAKKIKPKASLKEVMEAVRSNHPKNFKEAMQVYRKVIKKAREFVIKNKIATIPKAEKLIVIETPVYMRHTTPFAAYYPPPKFDKKQVGIYIVTPPENPERLREHNYPSIMNVSVHEAYPGHHLQLSCANTNQSTVRIFSHPVEFIEGWAHYCEEVMRDYGYFKKPEEQFEQTTDMIWRACRIIIDVKLHTGRMTFDQAVDFLVKNAGMHKESATAEVKRYTQAPTYQLSYLLGKHLIKKLRKDVKKKMGKKYSDRYFHDTLLYAGSLPIKYAKGLFGLK